MIELDDDTVQAIREGALPGMRFYRDSWDTELLFEAPETIEEFRALERRQVERQEAVVDRSGGGRHQEPLASNENFDGVDPPQPAPAERARRKRKPNLDKLIAKAKAAGATSVLVDGVEMRFGAHNATADLSAVAADDLDRELADFQERHRGRH